MKRTLLWVPFLAAALALPVMAQGDEEGPGRGVARISVINGDVSVRRSDTGDWVAAAINAPVIVSDSIMTGISSRAEVQLDRANMIRFWSATEVRFSELEENRYQMQIARGTVMFSILRDTEADVDLATPNVSVRPYRKGRYRVTVREDGATEIIVRSGEAEIYTPRGTEILKSGRLMLVRGTLSDPEYQIAKAPPKDSWDRWNEQRDKELKRSASYQYVSGDIYGTEDLDANGRWVYAPSYGYVWSPYVAAGWAPYRYGRWSWLDYYGWTWISYDPWGWAPYHYGRWFNYAGYGWCWWPGRARRNYWSPALVAFFGYGSGGFRFGFSFGVGYGNVGWVPLAPYERYYPWYGRGYYGGHGGRRTYIDNSVNIVNNVNITNVYRNARIRNGITAVDGQRFGRGNVRNTYRDGGARQAHLVRGQLPVVPGRESLRFSSRAAHVTAQPTNRSAERFYTRRSPSPGQRVSFTDQQRAMQQVTRRAARLPDSYRTSESTRASRAASGAATGRVNNAETNGARSRMSQPAARAPANSGWRRTSEPARSSRATRSNATRGSAGNPTRSSAGGWQSFGQPSRPTATRTQTPRRTSSRTVRGTSQSVPSSTSRATTGRSGGWERFGQPTRSRSNTGSVVPSRTGRGTSSPSRSSGWNRFERRSQPSAPDRGSVSRSSGSRSTSFSRNSPSTSATRSRSGSASRSQRRSLPQYRTSNPTWSSGRTRSNAPAVWQRSAPRSVSPSRSPSRSSSPRVYGGGSRTYGSPSGSRSSGSYSRPSSSRSSGSFGRSSTPSRPSVSAPSRGGGGRVSAPSRSSGGGSSRGGASRSSGRRR